MIQLHEMPLPSTELQVLAFLDSRMSLSADDRKRLLNLTKGFEGERQFFQLLQERQTSRGLNLFDLRLRVDQSECQIDSLLIFQDVVWLVEVKNFAGEYIANHDKWSAVNAKYELSNPLSQLQRSELLLQKFFHQHGVNLPIKSFLVFIHPEFFLYQAPYHESFIFPNQLHRFMQQINTTRDVLSQKHRRIQDGLVRHHIGESTHVQIPDYDYRQLRKGLLCGECGGVMASMTMVRRMVKCTSCGREESKDQAILRSVYEFSVLFPGKKISVSKIYHWCGGSLSKKVIRKVLMQELKITGTGRSVNYILDDQKKMFILRKYRWNSPNMNLFL